MNKFKANLIKMLAVVFAVCSVFALAFIPQADVVKAEDEATFKVRATSIRDGSTDGLFGLKFTTNVNDAWLTANPSTKYSFGTIIAPVKTKTGEDNLVNFDATKSTTKNMEDMDGITIIETSKEEVAAGFDYSASIIFDEAVVEQAITDANSNATADEILSKLYKKEFVAIPYAITDSDIIYAEQYVDTMYGTAIRTIALGGSISEEMATMIFTEYLGITEDDSFGAYVVASDGKVVADKAGFQVSADDVIIEEGKVWALGTDYTISADGEIQILNELTASKEVKEVVIIQGNKINYVELSIVDQAISTAEQFLNYIKVENWAEETDPFAEITILVNDIDMSSVGEVIIAGGTKPFRGSFDGRGHVISNLTYHKTNQKTADGEKVVYAPIFGDLQNSANIKNVAFNDLYCFAEKATVGYDVNSGWFTNNLRGTVENIYVKHAPGSQVQQMLMYATAGYLNNVIIEVPYDEDLDVNAKINEFASNWGRSYLARMINTAAVGNMTNVHVISQLPLITYGTSSTIKEPTYTDGAVSTWNSWFAYGENETEVWYDFDFFHNTTGGLGLAAGTQNVENTQVLVDGQSMKQGVTRVWKGVNCYETLAEMVEINPDAVSAFVDTGMWKIANGKLVWSNHQNVTTYIGGEYDASQNQLISTALNGEVVTKVTVNGVELSLADGEYTVDENGYLTSIYAKTSETDSKNGISYKVNSANNDISDKVVIYTLNGVYTLNDVSYYTRIIDSAEELELALEIDFTTNQTDVESSNGIVYNTHTDGVTYVFNAGIYKLNANIDMYDSENEEYIVIDYPSITITTSHYYGYQEITVSSIAGGFTGVFDGAGYVIDNFKPTVYGMFGVLGTTGSGLTTGASIKNVAFTNVLTESTKTGAIVYPVIASHMYASEEVAQNISDVYVTYSENATDMYGLIANPTVKLYMNNVYVVNEAMYNAIDADKLDQYYGITLDANKKYRNIFVRGVNSALNERTSALFASIRKMSNISTTYINNVLVASPNLLSYNYDFDFAMQTVVTVNHVTRTYKFTSPFYSRITCSPSEVAYYYCSNCGYYYASEECTKCGEDAVLGALTKARSSSKSRAFAFAGNEETSTVPVIKGFAPSIIADLEVAPYKDGEGNLINTFSALGASGKGGYVCDTCDAKNISLIGGSDCTVADCEGKMSVKATVANGLTYEDYNSVWASPMAYEWTLYDLTSRNASNTMADSNAIVRLMGVTRYDTVAEINEKADLTSFKASKVWTVTEDGLAWASLVA